MDPNSQIPQQQIGYQAQPTFAPSGIHPVAPGAYGSHKTPVGLIIVTVVLLLSTVLLAVLLVIFYGQAQDYKTNSDLKSAAAVAAALKDQETSLKAQFAETEKEPLREYITPSSAASVKIVYPKTWSLYAIEGKNSNTVNNYFHPQVINDVGNKDNLYALRLEVLDRVYSSTIKEYESKAKSGAVKISPYVAQNVPGAETGIRVDGEIMTKINGSMVILPVRDKTIRVWTESNTFVNDFNNFVLKNLSYNP
jgi:cell division protein FtsB